MQTGSRPPQWHNNGMQSSPTSTLMRVIRPLRSFLPALVAMFAMVAVAHAAPVRTGHVTAELVSEQTALVPGTTATLALRLAIEPGWHTYWRNPGESGLPTTLAWHLPPGYSAGDIAWPAPRALPAGPLMNYGYEGEVFHLVPLMVPADAAPGVIAPLLVRADWLVCKETCIPEGADLTLELPLAKVAQPSRWHDAIAATRAALPGPLPAGWQARATASGAVITLTLDAPAKAADPGRLQFFALDERRIEPSVAQKRVASANGGYAVQLPVSHELTGDFPRLQGVLRAEKGIAGDGRLVSAVALDLPLAGAPVAGAKPVQVATPDLAPPAPSGVVALSLPLALAFAFGGGLLLNLMPCVFPILSLKALGLATSPADDRRTLRHDGVAFAGGVVLAFAALGVALATLRAAGEELGWGFQLQSPAVVTSLAILFFVMALNLSGVFEFASLVPSRIASWSHANRHVNAFASGVLAVAIASPCTAPFMGAALGYALGERAQVTLGVFVALGLGMALPYVALAWFPQWRRVLPRPGAWMQRLKQLLAFPLYATVAWLVWVLAAQVGLDAVIRIGAVLVLVAFALWAWRTWRAVAHRAWSAAALGGAIAGVLVAWPLFAGERAIADMPATQAANGWQVYSPASIAQLTAEGRPVFVDFTAAWCITCQVNERFVLNDARVREAFARGNVALVRADWTRRDSDITEALAALGRSGVPAYVIYRRGRPPQLLPEVLQRQSVIDALAS
jgi:thiol:disulfide interchange protein/DsbC/DsbD-like thiol-disulfide interchange protein